MTADRYGNIQVSTNGQSCIAVKVAGVYGARLAPGGSPAFRPSITLLGSLHLARPGPIVKTAPRRVIDPSGANTMSHQPPKQEKKKPLLTPKEKKAVKQQKKNGGAAVPLIRR